MSYYFFAAAKTQLVRISPYMRRYPPGKCPAGICLSKEYCSGYFIIRTYARLSAKQWRRGRRQEYDRGQPTYIAFFRLLSDSEISLISNLLSSHIAILNITNLLTESLISRFALLFSEDQAQRRYYSAAQQQPRPHSAAQTRDYKGGYAHPGRDKRVWKLGIDMDKVLAARTGGREYRCIRQR